MGQPPPLTWALGQAVLERAAALRAPRWQRPVVERHALAAPVLKRPTGPTGSFPFHVLMQVVPIKFYQIASKHIGICVFHLFVNENACLKKFKVHKLGKNGFGFPSGFLVKSHQKGGTLTEGHQIWDRNGTALFVSLETV